MDVLPELFQFSPSREGGRPLDVLGNGAHIISILALAGGRSLSAPGGGGASHISILALAGGRSSSTKRGTTVSLISILALAGGRSTPAPADGQIDIISILALAGGRSARGDFSMKSPQNFNSRPRGRAVMHDNWWFGSTLISILALAGGRSVR